MNTYIMLAWRNLWRNKRRTLIAASSVFFAVIVALLMRSMQIGYYDYMIDSSVRMYTGYIQVQGKDYWEKKSLEESMTIDDSQFNQLINIQEITHTVKRLETFSLLSHEMVTKVVQITGIEPERENELTSLKDKLVKGSYLAENSTGILLAEGLARSMQVDIGDTVLIYGQGLYGVTAAELISVQGIVKFNIPAQNNGLAYVSLSNAQWIFSAYENITSLSIMIDDTDKLEYVAEKARLIFDDTYDVLTWRELSPELVQSIQIDNAQGIIMLGILYVVIAFGIFGTIMMMTAERVKEFGVLISVGMKKWKLYTVTLLETLFISFIGVITGAIASLPLLFYFVNNPIPLKGEYEEALLAWGFEPILPFAVNIDMFVAQIWTVLAIALVSGLYPVNFIRKIKPVEAIRG